MNAFSAICSGRPNPQMCRNCERIVATRYGSFFCKKKNEMVYPSPEVTKMPPMK